MKVAELIERLSRTVDIKFRDSKDKYICDTRSTSKGIEPYLEYDVLKWYPAMTVMNMFICILLEDKDGGDAE